MPLVEENYVGIRSGHLLRVAKHALSLSDAKTLMVGNSGGRNIIINLDVVVVVVIGGNGKRVVIVGAVANKKEAV